MDQLLTAVVANPDGPSLISGALGVEGCPVMSTCHKDYGAHVHMYTL